ncbi:hypothetical protein CUC04_10765 [Prevotella intermedia]|uniref:Uncharacterized protein n=1 Tax=Prevotella intermedia TaxID=28131 RepID=A0A2G9IDG2_PREIN|nr:hypothetical protein CUC04_10765 [Prevotella intermedia]
MICYLFVSFQSVSCCFTKIRKKYQTAKKSPIFRSSKSAFCSYGKGQTGSVSPIGDNENVGFVSQKNRFYNIKTEA